VDVLWGQSLEVDLPERDISHGLGESLILLCMQVGHSSDHSKDAVRRKQTQAIPASSSQPRWQLSRSKASIHGVPFKLLSKPCDFFVLERTIFSNS
jgi:hypothetical protein